MLQLNLPSFDFKIKKNDEKFFIFDAWRKRYVALTPEEWVRQHFLHFLVNEKQVPMGRISVEKTVMINGMKKRCDAIIYNQDGNAISIVELKAPHVVLSQAVCDQVAIYNSKINVDYFIISNGLEHHAGMVNKAGKSYIFLPEIPNYKELNETHCS